MLSLLYSSAFHCASNPRVKLDDLPELVAIKRKFTLQNFDRKKDGTVDEELGVTSPHL